MGMHEPFPDCGEIEKGVIGLVFRPGLGEWPTLGMGRSGPTNPHPEGKKARPNPFAMGSCEDHAMTPVVRQKLRSTNLFIG